MAVYAPLESIHAGLPGTPAALRLAPAGGVALANWCQLIGDRVRNGVGERLIQRDDASDVLFNEHVDFRDR